MEYIWSKNFVINLDGFELIFGGSPERLSFQNKIDAGSSYNLVS